MCYGDIWTYCCLGTKIVYFGVGCYRWWNVAVGLEGLAREGNLDILASWGMLLGILGHAARYNDA